MINHSDWRNGIQYLDNAIQPLRIGNLKATIPIIQGGMGVGISLSRLAAAVANEGGIGVISATGIGMLEPDFNNDTMTANRRRLYREISEARRTTKGIIGVNILVALTDYYDVLKTAIDAGADLVFMGAGLPLKLPEVLLPGSPMKIKTKIVPIVSSAKAAQVIFHYWQKNFHRLPDALVVEGPMAGGHLGFKKDQLNNPDFELGKLLTEVIAVVSNYEKYSDTKIPVIAAGGIFTGADIFKFMSLGASGVQMATRFVGTHECDAAIEFKEAYLRCNKEDLMIIDSPVGLPGRAIRNAFLNDISENKRIPFKCHWHCLKTCNPEKSRYCICLALINAKIGKLRNGFAFAGANAYRVKTIISVRELITLLLEEYQQAVTCAGKLICDNAPIG